MLGRREKGQGNEIAALSAHLKEREERLERLLERLAEESARGTPIVVEGKKDIAALRALGVEGQTISVKTSGKSLLDAVCEIEHARVRRVILLLDHDRRGKDGTRRLKKHLEEAKITPDLAFWNQIFGLVGREVKDVEGLTAYMERLKSKSHNS